MTHNHIQRLIRKHAFLRAEGARLAWRAGRCDDGNFAQQMRDNADDLLADAEAIAALLAVAAPDVAQPDPRQLSLMSDGAPT